MPYIITTTTPDPGNARDYGKVGDATPGAPTLMGAVRGCWPPKISRQAAATLEEARKAAAKALPRNATNIAWEHARLSVEAGGVIGESGGTIGPLPDGTVIEVRAR